MYYLVVAILVFIGVIVYSTYTEKYPDGLYFQSDRGDHIILLATIAILLSIGWPIILIMTILYSLIKLIINVTLKIKDRKNAKAH